MSVKHIIEECTKYTTYRLKHKIPTTLKDALGNNNNNIYNIIKFLAEIDLLKQISDLKVEILKFKFKKNPFEAILMKRNKEKLLNTDLSPLHNPLLNFIS